MKLDSLIVNISNEQDNLPSEFVYLKVYLGDETTGIFSSYINGEHHLFDNASSFMDAVLKCLGTANAVINDLTLNGEQAGDLLNNKLVLLGYAFNELKG